MQPVLPRFLRLLCSAIFSAALAVPAASAQTPGPSPSPAQFHSPFNGDRDPKGEEAKDFGHLMDLYDAMKDAEVALKAAELCKGDIEAAKKALAAAMQALENGVATYINNWSNNTYGVPPGTEVTPKRLGKNSVDDYTRNRYKNDEDAVLGELAKQDKKQHVVGPCPGQNSGTLPSTPKSDAKPGLRNGLHYFGKDFGLKATLGSVDYSHFMPSSGSTGDQFGLGGSALFGLTDKLGLNFDGGYHNVSSSGPALDSLNFDTALAWRFENLRFGPVLGYQSNSAGHVTTDTFNYGAYVDYYGPHSLAVSLKGGGFSSSYHQDGYYLGGQLQLFPTDRFAVGGAYDYTYFSSHGFSSHESDIALKLEYLFWDYDDEDEDDCGWPPTSIFGGYTYSAFPGSFHVDTLFVGFRFYTNGEGANSLHDLQQTGTVTYGTLFAPLSYRF